MKSDKLISAVEGVTKKWAKQRKAEERQASARLNREIAMLRRPHISIRDAAWGVMEAAYMKASATAPCRPMPVHAGDIELSSQHLKRLTDEQLAQLVAIAGCLAGEGDGTPGGGGQSQH